MSACSLRATFVPYLCLLLHLIVMAKTPLNSMKSPAARFLGAVLRFPLSEHHVQMRLSILLTNCTLSLANTHTPAFSYTHHFRRILFLAFASVSSSSSSSSLLPPGWCVMTEEMAFFEQQFWLACQRVPLKVCLVLTLFMILAAFSYCGLYSQFLLQLQPASTGMGTAPASSSGFWLVQQIR